MDYAALFDVLVKNYGPLAAIVAGIAYFLWRDRGSRKLADADSSSSVDAIVEWKAIAQELRVVNKELAERADEFARDRNERIAQIGTLQAQIAAMEGVVKAQTSQINQLTQQLEAARSEITRLTQEIAQLRGQR